MCVDPRRRRAHFFGPFSGSRLRSRAYRRERQTPRVRNTLVDTSTELASLSDWSFTEPEPSAVLQNAALAGVESSEFGP